MSRAEVNELNNNTASGKLILGYSIFLLLNARHENKYTDDLRMCQLPPVPWRIKMKYMVLPGMGWGGVKMSSLDWGIIYRRTVTSNTICNFVNVYLTSTELVGGMLMCKICWRKNKINSSSRLFARQCRFFTTTDTYHRDYFFDCSYSVLK